MSGNGSGEHGIQVQEARYLRAHETTLTIRWADMDSFGHVNNTMYFRYVEQARIEWLRAVMGPRDSSHAAAPEAARLTPVVVNSYMNFRQQLVYPANVLCRTLAGPPGRSSVQTLFEIRAAEAPDEVYAEGGAKIVWIDMAANKSVPLPEPMRAWLAALQDNAV